MNKKFHRILLNLFDQYQKQRQFLSIDIEKDLLPIFPLPIDLILSLLFNKIPSIFAHLSDNQKEIQFGNSLKLCSKDQKSANSCQTNECFDLHLCWNYLLTSQCLEFQSNGFCSHCHSIETEHNERILRKLFLNEEKEEEENIFELISHLFRLSIYQEDFHSKHSSIILHLLNEQNLTRKLLNYLFQGYQDVIRREILLDPSTILITFDDDEVRSLVEDGFKGKHSKTIRIERSSFLDEIVHKKSSITDQSSSPRSLTLTSPTNLTGKSFSTRLRPPIKCSSTSPKTLSSNGEEKQKKTFSTRLNSSKPSSSIKEKSLIDYFFIETFSSENLSFLLGPGKSLVDQQFHPKLYPYLSSGFCRVENVHQGQLIEKHLFSILPDSLSIEPVQLNSNLRLFIDSAPIEEYLCKYSSDSFALMTEQKFIQTQIELIEENKDDNEEGNSLKRTKTTGIDDENQFQLKLVETNSSLNVVHGNICHVQVDLMICISTSYNLRDSILRQAGQSVIDQYKSHDDPQKALLTDGGLTSAKKILFLPWNDEIQSTDFEAIQQSLADLVQWSIDQAKQRHFHSISFPPIGTGQLNLDPTFVCQTMIDATLEKLSQNQLDVFFVIYQSNECFQIFRMFLESLVDRSEIQRKAKKKIRFIEKMCSGKLLYTISDKNQTDRNHPKLIKALENLYVEQKFDLDSIDRRFSTNIDELISECLKYKLNLQIDLIEKEFRLKGNQKSIEQFVFHLKNSSKVYQYDFLIDQQQIILNPFISIQIDQFATNRISTFSIRENSQLIYQIDLNRNEISTNEQNEKYSLRKKLLDNDQRRQSSMMFNQIDLSENSFSTLKCFHRFHQTMSNSLWKIERIVEIENHRFDSFCSLNDFDLNEFYFHGTSFYLAQSISHYGFHSTNSNGDSMTKDTICLTSDAWTSHLNGSKRSTDGKFSLIVAQTSLELGKHDRILLSNDQNHLIRPTYILFYRFQCQNGSN